MDINNTDTEHTNHPTRTSQKVKAEPLQRGPLQRLSPTPHPYLTQPPTMLLKLKNSQRSLFRLLM
ncbi:hypothetical protein E2C01_085840 [Portunus trituberculatus]|uniref:Uncharacterized protein n=1 Tax=Portunus trituberculatus TaxID=210409 RepID=A0A5B7JBS6_PORTR|nr:hypothetical protein [Portunus trituberculatus]